MAESLKVLGQIAPAITTLTVVYTVPALTSSVVSSIVATNRGGTAAAFRVSVAVLGAADDPKQYLYYDVPISANNSFVFTGGITLGAGDVIRVYGSSANFTFQVFGTELT